MQEVAELNLQVHLSLAQQRSCTEFVFLYNMQFRIDFDTKRYKQIGAAKFVKLNEANGSR